MTKNKLLYGVEDVPNVPQGIIDKRVKMLNDNLTALLAVPNDIRDSERIYKIVGAMKFWTDINKGI